jgi:predicted alpha/beta-fold hydrolase
MQTDSYTAPRWLPGGHLQTIYSAKCAHKPTVTFRRERWPTPDQDFIDIDFVDGEVGKPFVVLFHGLEGSSNSHYARSIMAEIQQRGWSGAVPHFRGCSGEINLTPRLYHSGDATEINWILRQLAQHPKVLQASRFYASGVSLGGNALLKWLGESGHQADFIHAACAISAPMDLTASGMVLGKGFNRIYTYVFLRTMRKKSLQKLAQFPDLFDRTAMLKARDLYTFDNIVTAPLHGFLNTEDYWYNASAKWVLNDITVPTLVLNAQNDPFLPKQFLPTTAASSVTLDYPKWGGHVGFPSGKFPGQLDWLPHRLLHYFEQH